MAGRRSSEEESSSEEFEDADDGLGPLPGAISSPLPAPRPLTECSITPSPQPSSSIYVNVTAPAAVSPQLGKQDACSVSRRGRLSILRGRMRSEFGGQPLQGTPFIEDDGSASESASLASWGRNLLMEHSALTLGPFFPADSMSTKAFSINGTAPHDHLVSPLLTTPDGALRQTAPRSLDVPSRPPAHPPPPLPSSPCPSSINGVLLPPPNAVPPPLPPRNPALRLPSALPPQVVCIVTESSPAPNTSLQPTQKNEMEVSPATNELPTSSSNYARRRGHAKTNSLDRGLSLAKCMKTGPFPPPANKSNSLKRECSVDGEGTSFLSLDGGEEDIRNSDAQGIIHQITSSILKEDPLSEECSSSESNSRPPPNGRLSSVGEELSIASASASPLSVKTNSKDEKALLDSIEVIEVPVDSTLLHAAAPSSHHAQIASDSLKDATLKREDVQEESPDYPKAFSMQAFVDPITRDVERRMSMKGHHGVKGEEEEGSGTVALSSTGSIERAATLMRGYGNLASGLFRGALSRARNVVSSNGSAATKLPKEEEESGNESEKEDNAPGESAPIVRPKSAKKGPFDFDGTRLVQELNNEHTGAVWCMKFSLCGRLLATAGQDNIIRVWVLRNHLAYFNAMRDRYNSQSKQNSSASLGDSLLHSAMQQIENDFCSSTTTLGDSIESAESREDDPAGENRTVMAAKPLCTYRGHTADVLDLSWSRSYFILSSGMDRTVKLWHLSRPECLCCFQHMDFVTCIAFMPKDDRYFLSGSLDGKLRLWHIPDKKVALWNEVEQVKFITAIAFVKNGKFAVVGTYDGRCFFYSTDQLKYHTVIDVRSSRGKNARGHKVTGLAVHGDKLLVTSNDSRVRMYDLRDMALTCKFKGAQNERSQIRASFSPDGKHIVCGSEDRYVYIWTTADLPSSLSVRKDRNDSWQRIRCHSACVSAAIFAPRPALFLSLLEHRRSEDRRGEQTGAHGKNTDRQLLGDVIISADLHGSIKILANRTRIKAGVSNFFTSAIG